MNKSKSPVLEKPKKIPERLLHMYPEWRGSTNQRKYQAECFYEGRDPRR